MNGIGENNLRSEFATRQIGNANSVESVPRSTSDASHPEHCNRHGSRITNEPRLRLPGTLGFCARPSLPLILPRGVLTGTGRWTQGSGKSSTYRVQCPVYRTANSKCSKRWWSGICAAWLKLHCDRHGMDAGQGGWLHRQHGPLAICSGQRTAHGPAAAVRRRTTLAGLLLLLQQAASMASRSSPG